MEFNIWGWRFLPEGTLSKVLYIILIREIDNTAGEVKELIEKSMSL